MNHKLRVLVVLFGAVFALAGCGGSGGDNKTDTSGGTALGCGTTGRSIAPAPTRATGDVVPQSGWTLGGGKPTLVQPRKKWTFVVYMNGANNLEPYARLNLNQMESVGSDANVNIVCQVKRLGGRYDTSGPTWSDTRRFLIEKDSDKDNINSILLSSRADCDMGQAQSLRDFVDYAVTAFPAERYALIMWNHGAGWRSQKISRANTPSIFRGVSYDDVTGNHIDTIQFPAAMQIATKWDLLIWDSSLMQMTEVAYQVAGVAQYMVGSEESPPGEGLPYDRWLSRVTANPSLTPLAVGRGIADDTIAAYTDSAYLNYWNIGSNNATTQSVVDLSQVCNFAKAFDTLGTALNTAKATQSSSITTAREGAETYTDPYTQNKDGIDYLNHLLTSVSDTGVRNAALTAKATLQNAIAYNVNGPGHPSSQGLALFVPSQSEYARIDRQQADGFGQRYSAIAFAKDAPNWQSFLTASP